MPRWERQAESFNGGKASAAGADRPGDELGEREIGRAQVDIEGDEDLTCADNGCAGREMEGGAAGIGRAGGIGEGGFAKRFELAMPHMFEETALGDKSRFAVEIDGNRKLGGHATADRVSEFNALRHCGIGQGNERQNVEGAQARVNAAVGAEVDEVASFTGGNEGRLGDGVGTSGKGDDAAVVIPIAGAVENQDAGDAAHGGSDAVDARNVAAFREVRDAFDDCVFQAALTFQPVRLKTMRPSRTTMPT